MTKSSNRRISILVIAATMMAGCASTTGVVPVADDIYKIFKKGGTGFAGSDSIKSEVMMEASQFCSTKGKQIFVVSEILGSPPYILGNFPKAEIQFRCVSASELAASQQKAPPGDALADLKRLKELLDNGTLTQAEFETQKAKILAR